MKRVNNSSHQGNTNKTIIRYYFALFFFFFFLRKWPCLKGDAPETQWLCTSFLPFFLSFPLAFLTLIFLVIFLCLNYFFISFAISHFENGLSERLAIPSVHENVEHLELSTHIVGGSENVAATFETSLAVSF